MDISVAGDCVFQEDPLVPETSTLPFLGVQGEVLPQEGYGNVWDMQLHGASFLSPSPQLEAEFGFFTAAGMVSWGFHQQPLGKYRGGVRKYV